MGMVKLTVLLFVAAGLFGCALDVEREAGRLRFDLGGVDPSAERVRIGLESSSGERFTLTSTLGADGARPPEVSAPVGLLSIRAETLGADEVVLQRLDDELDVRLGINEVRLSFSSGPLEPGRQASTYLNVQRTFDVWDEQPRLEVEVPVPRSAILMAISALEAELGGPPLQLELLSLTVIAEGSPGDGSGELDDHFSGRIDLSVTGGGVDEAIPGFTPYDDQVSQTVEVSLSLDEWLTAPSDARIVLRGETLEGGPDAPFVVGARLSLRGSR